MLSKPGAGWTTLKIGELEFVASYLTDVPQQFIEAFENILKDSSNKQIIVLDGEEKGDLIFIISKIYFYAIKCNKNKLYDLNEVNIYKLIKEFIKDIESNYIFWQNWMYDEEPRKYDLSELKRLLKE